MARYRSNNESSDEMYRLRWDSSKQVVDLSNAFQHFRDEEELLDVSLVCSDSNGGSVTIKAHKVVLAAYSTVFQDMFKSLNDKKDPAIFLKGISHNNLSSMLDFMYQGSVDIPKSVLNDFIADAEELQIKGLRGGNDDGGRKESPRSAKPIQKNTNITSKYDSIKKPNKSVKRELEDILAEDSFDSPDLSRYDTLSAEAEVGDLKRAKRPPKKAKKEQDESMVSLITDSEQNDSMADISHRSVKKESKLNLSSMDSEEKARLDSNFEKLDKWGGSEARKRSLFQCRHCSWEGRSDKRAQHFRANHANNQTL